MASDMMFNPARARVAAGALFHDGAGKILLVKPSYKPLWDLPGGYVEPGETPSQACIREVTEELGLRRPIGRPLVIDWAPATGEGDKILFVFDGGVLGPTDMDLMELQQSEIVDAAFFDQARFVELLPERLQRRLTAAIRALETEETIYLESRASRTPAD